MASSCALSWAFRSAARVVVVGVIGLGVGAIGLGGFASNAADPALSIQDPFTKDSHPQRIAVRGDWQFENGVAACVADPELYKKFKNHGPIIRYPIAYGGGDGEQLLVEFEAKPKDVSRLVVTLNGDGHVYRIIMPGVSPPKSKPAASSSAASADSPNQTKKQNARPASSATRVLAWAERSGPDRPGDSQRPQNLPTLMSLDNEWTPFRIVIEDGSAEVSIGEDRWEDSRKALSREMGEFTISFAFGKLELRNLRLAVTD